MRTVEHDTSATPEQVFAVLSDGWLFPVWVVGASRMRDVDAEWPALGAQLHHSFGVWPVVVDDTTEVLEVEPPGHIVLKARGWPAGEAKVELTVTPHGSGARLRIAEDAVSGPGRLVPGPVRQVLMVWRNREALRRLAAIAENRDLSRLPG